MPEPQHYVFCGQMGLVGGLAISSFCVVLAIKKHPVL